MAGDGAAQGDAGQQGDGQAGGEQQGGPDYGALTSTLEGQTQTLEQLRDLVQGLTPAEQAEAGEEGIDWSALYGGDGEQEYADPQQAEQERQQQLEAAQQQTQTLQQLVQQEIQKATAPLTQQMQERQMEQQARDLVEQHPELGQEDTANRVIDMVNQFADQNLPPEVAAMVKNSPPMWGLMYQAMGGVEAANREGAGAPAAAHLESGSGARPAAGGQAMDGNSFFGLGGESEARLPFS